MKPAPKKPRIDDYLDPYGTLSEKYFEDLDKWWDDFCIWEDMVDEKRKERRR